jgi:hypothetical protein
MSGQADRGKSCKQPKEVNSGRLRPMSGLESLVRFQPGAPLFRQHRAILDLDPTRSGFLSGLPAPTSADLIALYLRRIVSETAQSPSACRMLPDRGTLLSSEKARKSRVVKCRRPLSTCPNVTVKCGLRDQKRRCKCDPGRSIGLFRQ